MTVAVYTKNAPSETYQTRRFPSSGPTAPANSDGSSAWQSFTHTASHTGYWQQIQAPSVQRTFISLLLQKISPLFVWALKKNNHFFSPSMATYWNQSLQQFKAAFLSSHPSVASCNTWRVADRIYPANYLIPSLTVHVLKKKWL